jgi:hypothetical protein
MKRVKQVFTNSQAVASLYVKQSQDYACSKYNARNGARGLISTYFQGRDMFSYGRHYLLARMGLTFHGQAVSIVNFSNYSNSTSGHSREVLQALTDAGQFVLKVEAACDAIRAGISDSELTALAEKYLESQAETFRRLQSEMKVKPFGLWYLKSIRDEMREHNQLVARFNLNHLIVPIDSKAFKSAIRLNVRRESARRDHARRKQEFLDIKGLEYNIFGYRSCYNSTRRRTA